MTVCAWYFLFLCFKSYLIQLLVHNWIVCRGRLVQRESTHLEIFLAQRDRGSKHAVHRRLFSRAINKSHLGLMELRNHRKVNDHATFPGKAVATNLSVWKGYITPKIGPMMFERCHHILYYATLHPTMQPTTVPAYSLTYSGIQVLIVLGQDDGNLIG